MNSKNLDKLRAEIAALHSERRELEAMRRSRAEVRATVTAQIESWRAEGREAARRMLRDLANDSGHTRLHAQTQAPGYTAGHADLGPALSGLLGAEVVGAFLLADLDTIPEGFDKPAREARLSEIAEELDKLEREEEAVICALEAEGESVMRRPDARPEIIIGEYDPPPPSKGALAHIAQAEQNARILARSRAGVIESPYLGASR
jgi:hypothetical protein